jgi:hypothetical protein
MPSRRGTQGLIVKMEFGIVVMAQWTTGYAFQGACLFALNLLPMDLNKAKQVADSKSLCNYFYYKASLLQGHFQLAYPLTDGRHPIALIIYPRLPH